MKKQPAVRGYSFSDGILKQKADDIASSVTRDQAEFTPRGIAPVNVTAFSTQSTDFGNIATDEELLGAVSVATEAKDAAAELVRLKIRTLRTMAANKWGEGSARYRTYKFTNLTELPDEDLVRLGKRASRVGNNQLADLASEGLNVAFLAALDGLVADFDTKIDLQNDAEEARDIATEDRIEAGNALYRTGSKFCNTGKDIWINVDEAKYNDYVIYDAPEPPPGP